MKKKMSVIEINGIKGLLLMVCIGVCLAAGFIGFPGLVAMFLWNKLALHIGTIPTIGIIQGILLWGILVAGYYTFRKEKLVVCIKSPKGLSEDELKAVFDDLRKQNKEDAILQAMLKAKETELKIKEKDDEKLTESK